MIAGIINIEKEIIRPVVHKLSILRIGIHKYAPDDIFTEIIAIQINMIINQMLIKYSIRMQGSIHNCLYIFFNTINVSDKIINPKELSSALGQNFIRDDYYYIMGAYGIYRFNSANNDIIIPNINNVIKLFIKWLPKMINNIYELKLIEW